jgi:hypothetical protein
MRLTIKTNPEIVIEIDQNKAPTSANGGTSESCKGRG